MKATVIAVLFAASIIVISHAAALYTPIASMLSEGIRPSRNC